MIKRQLREEFLKKRRDLSESEWESKSLLVQERAIRDIDWKKTKVLGLYAHRGREVAVDLLFRYAKERNVVCVFPRVVSVQHIHYYVVNSFGHLSPGAFGILEPILPADEVLVKEIDLFIVPGLAFDLSGVRLGYGRGYFDRFLKSVDSNRVIGLAFDVQVTDTLPHHSHDVKVGKIVTESRVVEV